MPGRKWAYALICFLAAGIYAIAHVGERCHAAMPVESPAPLPSKSRNEEAIRRSLEGIGHIKNLNSVPLPSAPEH